MSAAFQLRKGDLCPVHRSFYCCGRKASAIPRRVRVVAGFGVEHVLDEHHPRGYREKRSREAMRRLLNQKIVEQEMCCSLCGKEFTDYREIVPDHTEPRSLGGARRDDHPSNITASHRLCNSEKGSRRIA